MGWQEGRETGRDVQVMLVADLHLTVTFGQATHCWQPLLEPLALCCHRRTEETQKVGTAVTAGPVHLSKTHSSCTSQNTLCPCKRAWSHTLPVVLVATSCCTPLPPTHTQPHIHTPCTCQFTCNVTLPPKNFLSKPPGATSSGDA